MKRHSSTSGEGLDEAWEAAGVGGPWWRSKWLNVVAPLFFIAVIIGIWEISVRVMNVPDYLLPPPSSIASVMVEERATLAEHFKVTAREVLGGFLLATCYSVLLASALAYSKLFRRTFMPLLVASKAVPTIAIAPLLLIWFGYTYTSRVLVTALVCFFPITLNIADGLMSVDPKRKALFESLGSSWSKRFRLLDFRMALPHAFTGLKIAVPLCVIGSVISEWVGTEAGLGYLILVDIGLLNISRMFASITLLACTGIALYLCAMAVESLSMPWRRRSVARRRR